MDYWGAALIGRGQRMTVVPDEPEYLDWHLDLGSVYLQGISLQDRV
jgi:hypothetical protein